ncbi:MAG: M20/M25/M40 family metallo-hydrolase [Lachnospiraceae bacterium]|nr:M20/M25/M40 family metallo-hydrolase [Lachnospiraceae bacterium]
MKFNEELILQHLAGMVRFPTVSDNDPEKMDFQTFLDLHAYLERTYPLVHATLEKKVIGRAALLYKWKGIGAKARNPLLLAAHQDVVPAGDPAGWTYPPFEGVISDGALWGRGSCDCKSQIMAHMEAIEALIGEGFTPECDLYLAYGYNEEVGGSDANSAALMCGYLQEQGVRLGCVIDEGGGIGPDKDEGIDRDVAYINTAEKGYVDVAFIIRDKGGHSARPGKRSIVAELGGLAVKLHAAQYPFRPTATLIKEYEAKAPFMKDRAAAEAFLHMKDDFEAAIPFIEDDPGRAAKFHTTQALTMLQASERGNILPTSVRLNMNCRLQEGDTVASLLEKCRAIAGENVEVEIVQGREHSEISRTDTDAFACLSEAIHKISPDAVIVPAITGGGTDARNYYPICDSVYRFGGFKAGSGDNEHGFNEFFKQENCSQAPVFFYEMIKGYCG